MTKLKLLMTKLNCKETSSKKQEDRFMNKNQIFIKNEYYKKKKYLETSIKILKLSIKKGGIEK